MLVVGQLFELLSSKNDLAVMVEDFLNFLGRIFLVFQHQRIERRRLVDFMLAGRACHAVIGIRPAPTLQLRVAGNVAIDRADDLHFLIAREIGERLPHRHQLLGVLEVKLAVVQDEVALRVDVVKYCLVGFHRDFSEMFRFVCAAIVAFKLQG